MIWAGASYQPASAPQGAKVEQIFPRKDSRWTVAQTHIFGNADEWSHIVVFEGASELDAARYEIKPFGSSGWNNIIIRGSDGTDPATNGRRYYVVLP